MSESVSSDALTTNLSHLRKAIRRIELLLRNATVIEAYAASPLRVQVKSRS